MTSLSQFALSLGEAIETAGLWLSPILLLPLIGLAFPRRLAPILLPVSRLIGQISGGLLMLAGALGLGMALFQIANVLMRYVFGIGYGWAREGVVYAFAAMFLIGAAGTLRSGGHVRLDILYGQMSEKQKALVELIGTYLFLIPITLLVLDAFSSTLAQSWRILERSRESDGLPTLYLFKTLVPVFAITLLMQGWAQAIKAAFTLRGQAHLDREAGRDEVHI
jgi:TRAP-type mannitol/chloroaromatic compound transport system permease small subunit